MLCLILIIRKHKKRRFRAEFVDVLIKFAMSFTLTKVLMFIYIGVRYGHTGRLWYTHVAKKASRSTK